MLHQIAYISTSTRDVSVAEIESILDVSRRNNDRDGLTGILVYHRGMFFQMLEGARDAIHATMARIRHDPRHAGTTLIIDREIEAPSFPDWRMGFARPEDLSPEAQKAVYALTDLTEEGGRLPKADKAVAVLVGTLMEDVMV